MLMTAAQIPYELIKYRDEISSAPDSETALKRRLVALMSRKDINEIDDVSFELPFWLVEFARLQGLFGDMDQEEREELAFLFFKEFPPDVEPMEEFESEEEWRRLCFDFLQTVDYDSLEAVSPSISLAENRILSSCIIDEGFAADDANIFAHILASSAVIPVSEISSGRHCWKKPSGWADSRAGSLVPSPILPMSEFSEEELLSKEPPSETWSPWDRFLSLGVKLDAVRNWGSCAIASCSSLFNGFSRIAGLLAANFPLPGIDRIIITTNGVSIWSENDNARKLIDDCGIPKASERASDCSKALLLLSRGDPKTSPAAALSASLGFSFRHDQRDPNFFDDFYDEIDAYHWKEGLLDSGASIHIVPQTPLFLMEYAIRQAKTQEKMFLEGMFWRDISPMDLYQKGLCSTWLLLAGKLGNLDSNTEFIRMIDEFDNLFALPIEATDKRDASKQFAGKLSPYVAPLVAEWLNAHPESHILDETQDIFGELLPMLQQIGLAMRHNIPLGLIYKLNEMIRKDRDLEGAFELMLSSCPALTSAIEAIAAGVPMEDLYPSDIEDDRIISSDPTVKMWESDDDIPL